MPARDNFHQAVRQALIKEGWTITDDSLVVQFGGVDLYIDLGAEKFIAAEKNGMRIAVEIKRLSKNPLAGPILARSSVDGICHQRRER